MAEIQIAKCASHRNCPNINGAGKEENLYSPEMLEHAFANFEILELKSYECEIDEGPGHSGMSALVELVARRPECLKAIQLGSRRI